MKYIDADRLLEKLTERLGLFRELSSDTISQIRIDECKQIIDIIDSLQQDETQVDKMLCSQVWWEEQGWIMIPPDATIEGIDSLLRQVRKKLQQEQPEVDLEKITKYSRIKELPDGFEKEWLCYYHKNPEYNSAKFSHLSLIEREYIIARHFYELGVLNARREVSK